MAVPKMVYLGCILLVLVIMVEAKTPPGIAKNPSRATCKIKKYKMCYNLEHVCPKFCPDSCHVECASCKPICGPDTSSPPSDDGSDSPPSDSGDGKGGKKGGNDDNEGGHDDDHGGNDNDHGGKKGGKDDNEGGHDDDHGGKKGGNDDNEGGHDDDHGGKKGGNDDNEGGHDNDHGGKKGGKDDNEGDHDDDHGGKKGGNDDNEGGKKGDNDKDHGGKKGDNDKSDGKGGKKGGDDNGQGGKKDGDNSKSPSPSTPPTPNYPPTPSTPSSPPTPTPTPTPPSPPSPSPPTPSTPSSPPSQTPPSPTPSSPSPPTPSTPSSPPSQTPPSPTPSSSPSPPYSPSPSPKPPTPAPTTPSTPSSPPSGSGAASRKRVRCKNKNYGQCYNQPHVCPTNCPTSCQVDCVTCKPVCSCDYPGAVCQDPKFVGGDGITFYFHGKKDHDFCLVTDPNLHINAHFIGKRNQNLRRDFTWVESIGILFDNHKLFVGAKKTSTWDDANDRLSLAFDGEPIYLQETLGYEWKSTSTPQVTITRANSATNHIIVEVEGKLKITTKVVPITDQESRVHNYGITKEDCFAHLDLGFKFYSLTGKVDGVLGKTYGDDYVSKVNVRAAMSVVGGEREYATSSIFATDCLASRFGSDYHEESSFEALELAHMNCASGVNGEAGVVCKR